jgi:hypothetical protein
MVVSMFRLARTAEKQAGNNKNVSKYLIMESSVSRANLQKGFRSAYIAFRWQGSTVVQVTGHVAGQAGNQ